MKYFLLLSLASLLISETSLANWNLFPIPRLGKVNQYLNQNQNLNSLLYTNEYQLGDEWGKKEVTKEWMNQNSVLRAVAQATVRFGGGTGFYLGQIKDYYVVATNHHVCPSEFQCSWGRIENQWTNQNYKVGDFFGSWPEIDFALVAVKVSGGNIPKFEPLAYDFESPIEKGQPLITVGYGIADNPNRKMVAGEDSDCKVFSQTNEFKFMGDPDELNPGTYKAWSFANGCDVSHGDSGSAMVDRNTGKAIGIIWTGKIPKSAIAQNSKYLNEIYESNGADVWKELSFAVPGIKIKEFLLALSEKSETPTKTKEVIKGLFQK